MTTLHASGDSKGPLIQHNRWLIGAIVLSVIVLSLVAWAGFRIADGGTFAFDRSMLLSLRQDVDLARPIGPFWFKQSFIDITAVGGTTVLTLLTFIAIGNLLAAGKVADAVFCAVTTGGGSILGKLLKNEFARPRPTIVPHFIDVSTTSFPSGHTVNATIVLLALGAVFARSTGDRRRAAYIMAAALLLILLIGVSRVYLGVHYPSDVLAGWTVGGSWVLLCWSIARLRDQRAIASSASVELPATMRYHAKIEKP